jgi:hypothetical protein
MAVFKNSSPIVTDGLVLYLDAGNVKSYPTTGTTWTDLVGVNNGTLTNGPTFSTDGGGSIVFDGINDYGQVEHSDSLYITGSYTIEFWFKTIGSTANDNKTLWEKGVNKSIIQTYGPGTFYLHYIQTSPQTNAELMDGNWKHVVATWDKPNSIGYFYLNSVLKHSASIGSSGNFPNTNFMQIMGRIPQGTGFLNGKISTWRMYNKYLSPSEILQNYNATKQRFNLT